MWSRYSREGEEWVNLTPSNEGWKLSVAGIQASEFLFFYFLYKK